MAINCIFKKKNVEKTQRNGMNPESKTIVKYITQAGETGVSGEDAFQIYVSPQARIFNAGPASQTDTIYVYAFRGTTQLGTYVNQAALTAQQVTGITYTVNDNSTNMTTITVTVTNALTEDGGTLDIPVRYATDTYDSSTAYDASLWDASTHTFADASTYYSWTYVKPTSSSWNLDLTNENAGINATKDGSIYANAVRPTCTAKLTRGTEPVPEALYYIDTNDSNYTSKSPQDVSINPTSGVMTFGSGFTFTGLGLEIPIYAKVDNVEKARKIMTVTKSLAGDDGIARTYWLDLSADSIKVDKQNVCHPTSITAQVWKQENENNPTTTDECVIKWCYNSTDASLGANTYSSAITVDASKDYMTFKLYKDSSYFGESETVPILKDGKDGAGQVGPAGPVIRGPILWDSSMQSRRFCSGSGSGATDSSYIDIVYYDPSGGVNYHYYRCGESHDFHTGDSWPGSPEWIQAQGEYDFIATQLLLAEGAKIKFLTNNEFYLTDANGNIHGGGRASTADSSVIFWAGSEEGSTNINAAPFRVTYNGDIYAQSGVFAGYIQMPYTFVSALDPDELIYNSQYSSAIGHKYLTQTIWKGRLSSAPANPSTGWCYYNTSSSKFFYYYSSSWRQMTDQYEARGYIADNRAYLIADHTSGNYGMGDGGMLVLPEPSASLNGFTYHILIEPNVATRSPSGENPGISLMTVNQTESFKVYSYSIQLQDCKRLSFYGGHVEITCAPQHGTNENVVYRWIVTQCTGGVDLYSTVDGVLNNESSLIASYSSVTGYSTEGSYYCVTKIQADPQMPGSKNNDTLYVSRSS